MLGIAIVAVLIVVAGSALRVVREALRLKRRTAALADSQLFVALTNAQSETLHLQRSLTMLASQFGAGKSALDSIRESVTALRSLPLGAQFARIKTEFHELLSVLR